MLSFCSRVSCGRRVVSPASATVCGLRGIVAGHAPTRSRDESTSRNSTSSGSERRRGQATPRDRFRWSYDQVDQTGRTVLDAVYDRTAARVQEVLTAPMPALPHDGSVAPDFAIGFGRYDHHLRDAYRDAIAERLGLQRAEVRLSTAWSSRFDVKRFPRGVRQVVGVALVGSGEQRLLHADKENRALSQRVAALVQRVSSLADPALVALRFVSGTTEVPEVVANGDRVQPWQHAGVDHAAFLAARLVLEQVTKTFTVVIVYNSPSGRDAGGSPSDAVLEVGASTPTSFTTGVLPRWQRQFLSERVIPFELDLQNAQKALAAAAIALPEVLQSLPAETMRAALLSAAVDIIGNVSSVDVSRELAPRAAGRLPRVLPACFLHGSFLGGVAELAYLGHNPKVFATLVASPSDITLKTVMLRKELAANRKVMQQEVQGMSHN